MHRKELELGFLYYHAYCSFGVSSLKGDCVCAFRGSAAFPGVSQFWVRAGISCLVLLLLGKPLEYSEPSLLLCKEAIVVLSMDISYGFCERLMK